MGSLRAEAERLKFLVGQGRGEEVVHVVFVEQEAKARVENLGVKPKTRFQWDADYPGGYSELNEGKDRLMRVLVNKQVAISVAAALWRLTPETTLKQLAEGLGQQEAGER